MTHDPESVSVYDQPTAQAIQKALTQRNLAVACAILSVAISLALVMSNFLGQRKELKEAHGQILGLQGELINVQNALRANQQELLQTQEALRQAQSGK